MPIGATRFSTRELDEDARSLQWERWNRDALVALSCRTPGGRGLVGEEVTLDLGNLTLGHVHAERHHVARTAATVDASPTHSTVLYAMLHGRTTFTDRDGTYGLLPGDVIVIDADRPFERALTTDFAELVIKLPHDLPEVRRDATLAARPSGLAALRIRTLGRQVARSALASSVLDTSVRQVALDLIEDLTIAGGSGDRLALAHMVIDQHLDDATLSAPKLAATLEISERQLSRLFAESGSTFPRYVTEQRLRLAARLLAAPNHLTIGEVAARCGFSSPTYFSRVFRDQIGESPRQFRGRSHTDGAHLHFSAIAMS